MEKEDDKKKYKTQVDSQRKWLSTMWLHNMQFYRMLNQRSKRFTHTYKNWDRIENKKTRNRNRNRKMAKWRSFKADKLYIYP